MIKIELSILQTLAFFDIFGRPLTLEEIWKYLYKLKASQLQVLIGLEYLQKKLKINKKNISIINSLAFGTSNENSDIDILMITKKNRLWTTRALVILLLEIIGQNKN